MPDNGSYVKGLDPLPGGEMPRPAENPSRKKSEMSTPDTGPFVDQSKAAGEVT